MFFRILFIQVTFTRFANSKLFAMALSGFLSAPWLFCCPQHLCIARYFLPPLKVLIWFHSANKRLVQSICANRRKAFHRFVRVLSWLVYAQTAGARLRLAVVPVSKQRGVVLLPAVGQYGFVPLPGGAAAQSLAASGVVR